MVLNTSALCIRKTETKPVTLTEKNLTEELVKWVLEMQKGKKNKEATEAQRDGDFRKQRLPQGLTGQREEDEDIRTSKLGAEPFITGTWTSELTDTDIFEGPVWGCGKLLLQR